MKTLWYLGQMDFFDELHEESKHSLVANAEGHHWPAECDASELISPKRVYLVTEGRLELAHVTVAGRRLTLGHLEAGSIVGAFDSELPAGEDEFTCNSIRALENSGAVSYSRRYFMQMLERRPAVLRYVLRYLDTCRRRLEKRLVGVLFRNNGAKVAAVLLELAEEHGVRRPGGTVVLDPAPSHLEIGAMVGLPREEVSRALASLKDQGLVESGRRRIELPDREALRALLR